MVRCTSACRSLSGCKALCCGDITSPGKPLRDSVKGDLSFPSAWRVNLQVGVRELVRTALLIFLTSLAAFIVRPEPGEVAGALIFVLGITLTGAWLGLGAALISATAGFLLYNFYFAEPVLTFRLSTGNDIVPLVIFNLCALVAGVLAGRLKDRAQSALRANQNLANLLSASRMLQSALSAQDIADGFGRGVPGLAGIKGKLFRSAGAAMVPVGVASAATNDATIDPLGDDTGEIVHRGDQVILKLEGSSGALGALVIDGSVIDGNMSDYLSALSNLTALALERSILSEVVSEVRANERTEHLKTALLSSVSHDFRTPLATISASASSLIDYREQLDIATSNALLQGIVEECDRLNRFTANLLELTRLASGSETGSLQLLGVADMLGAAIRRIRPRLEQRQIETSIGAGDLLIRADAALFELVLVNVLENAVHYSRDGTRIGVEAAREGGACRISIRDEGEGIPSDQRERVFERFVQITRPTRQARGSGLGLAIVKGFVEALGGRIEACQPGIGDRGTEIRIILPLGEPC
jgi:two-component system, OmpR family, sensor histidine kinase KdpD